jgi:hypothetical protein
VPAPGHREAAPLPAWVLTHPVVESVPSNQKVESVPCPETGGMVEVVADIAAMATKGFTFDCPSCGGRHTITAETFDRTAPDSPDM